MPGSSPATLGKGISDIQLKEKPAAAAIAKSSCTCPHWCRPSTTGPSTLPGPCRRGGSRTRSAAPLPLRPDRAAWSPPQGARLSPAGAHGGCWVTAQMWNTPGIHNYLEEQVPSFPPDVQHLPLVQHLRSYCSSAFPFAFFPVFQLVLDLNSSASVAASLTRPACRFLVTLGEAQPPFPFSVHLYFADSNSLGLHLRWILLFPGAASLGSTQMEATSFEGTSAWEGYFPVLSMCLTSQLLLPCNKPPPLITCMVSY